MDSQTWTIIFAAINAVIAVTAVAAALTAPRISARLTAETESKRSKRQEKLWVFAQLMQNRPTSESLEAVRALNLIEVIYHDHKEIHRLWRELYDMLTNMAFFDSGGGVGWQLISQKKSALLSAMARDLDYDIDTFDVDRIYAPRWLVEQERINLADRKIKLPIADNIIRTGQSPTSSEGPNPSGAVTDGQTSPVPTAVPPDATKRMKVAPPLGQG